MYIYVCVNYTCLFINHVAGIGETNEPTFWIETIHELSLAVIGDNNGLSSAISFGMLGEFQPNPTDIENM